jgi:hypothetical protein
MANDFEDLRSFDESPTRTGSGRLGERKNAARPAVGGGGLRASFGRPVTTRLERFRAGRMSTQCQPGGEIGRNLRASWRVSFGLLAARRNRTQRFPLTLQAGGRRFDPVTAHSARRSHADVVRLRWSGVPLVPVEPVPCRPRWNLSNQTAT